MKGMTPNSLKAYLKKIGKKGGRATARRGTDFYSKIGKQGAKKRWKTRQIRANKASEVIPN